MKESILLPNTQLAKCQEPVMILYIHVRLVCYARFSIKVYYKNPNTTQRPDPRDVEPILSYQGGGSSIRAKQQNNFIFVIIR
jgi:hypothetical protein